MKRTLAIAGAVALLAAVIAWWRCGGSRATAEVTSAGSHSTMARVRRDPAVIARASIAGTVSDAARRPIAGARVCADGASTELDEELFRQPVCAVADARGAYAIERLLPAAYVVSAGAKGYEPARADRLRLLAGERRTGVDVRLLEGGAELTGVVSDVTGGPIGHAFVAATGAGGRGATVTTETDDKGRFALWVAAGLQRVAVSADGYADGWSLAQAPRAIEITMTPEATLAGVVIDAATRQPIEGAHVELATEPATHTQTTFSDASGEFRFRRLEPGRVVARAYGERGFGRTAGSVLVSLGQHVAGVVIEMSPARRVEGTVVTPDHRPCEQPKVELVDADGRRRVPLRGDGDVQAADGVPPGTYKVEVECRGFLAREDYPPLVVAEADVLGQTWEVTAGAAIRGRTLTQAGAVVPYAEVRIDPYNAKGPSETVVAGLDGTYAITGLPPAEYTVAAVLGRSELVFGDEGTRVTVEGTETVTHDVIVEQGGIILGTVVDEAGAPVPGERVMALKLADEGGGVRRHFHGVTSSDENGTFILRSLAPGRYLVKVMRSATSQFSSKEAEDAGTAVTAGATSTVKLVAEGRNNTITGTVVENGKPVADVYVTAVPESSGGATFVSSRRGIYFGSGKPVVTGTDGTFRLTRLGNGPQLVRAIRRGGGEAVAEHVSPGSRIKLEMRATATVSGAVRDTAGRPADDFTLVVEEEGGETRREQFYRTAGRYVIRDLVAGTYRITCAGAGGNRRVSVTVADGESKTLDLEIDALVDVVGRIVDHKTRAPVPNIRVSGSRADNVGEGGADTTDASGKFRLTRVPAGPLLVYGYGTGDGYRETQALRTVVASALGHDVGDIPIVRARAWGESPLGDPGFDFDFNDKTVLRVASVKPDGPAAAAGLVAGDIVVRVDGLDVTGEGRLHAAPALAAPPGTRVSLDVKRGSTIAFALAEPE